MTLAEWKDDFKGFVKSLEIPRDDYKGIMEYIDDVSEPHWIPVEQALPEKEGKYLCTRTATWCVDGKATKVADVAVLDYSDNIYDIWKGYGEIFQNGFAFGELWQGKLDKLQNVSAWMPLSAPYQPKNEVTE